MKDVFSVPPKILAEFAERAKRGEYDEKIGRGIYIFRVNGREEVCLVSLDPPVGHMKRIKQAPGTADK